MSNCIRRYCIAGINIEIDSPHYIEEIDGFRAFETDDVGKGYKVKLLRREEIPCETGIYLTKPFSL